MRRLLVAVMLVVSACGGSGGDEPAADTAEPGSETTTSDLLPIPPIFFEQAEAISAVGGFDACEDGPCYFTVAELTQMFGQPTRLNPGALADASWDFDGMTLDHLLSENLEGLGISCERAERIPLLGGLTMCESALGDVRAAWEDSGRWTFRSEDLSARQPSIFYYSCADNAQLQVSSVDFLAPSPGVVTTFTFTGDRVIDECS